jgi:hypothetical protein
MKISTTAWSALSVGKSHFTLVAGFGARTLVVHELDRPLTIAVFLNSGANPIRNELINKTYQLVVKYLEKSANK